MSSSRTVPRDDLRHILVVDEHARQRVAVELDEPGAVGCGAHRYVRHHRLHRLRAEDVAGLGIEAAQFGDHVADVVGIDLAQRV